MTSTIIIARKVSALRAGLLRCPATQTPALRLSVGEEVGGKVEAHLYTWGPKTQTLRSSQQPCNTEGARAYDRHDSQTDRQTNFPRVI